jgi:putative nucleic acid modification protein with dual OB domain
MRIVVNHLTRMERGYICVAGIDVETGAHVRPVVDHRMSEMLLWRRGGPFDIGALVDLGDARCIGTPPAVEDHSFSAKQARRLKDISPTVFWRMLERVARPGLTEIFGDELARHARTYALPTKTGTATLGCLLPAAVAFERNDAGKLRLRITDSAGTVSLSLTDLRFYQRDHETPRWELVEQASARLAKGVPAIVSVGLGRPYKMLGDSVYRHWLQANNLHLQDDPLWQERSLA